jgi:protein-S-isoprenylcysteine O-methyltransferase Ste14
LERPAARLGVSRLPSLGPRGEGWVVIQLVLLGLVVLAGALGPVYRGAFAQALAILGWLAILAGLVLAVRGIVDLRGALTPLPHPRDGAELVQSGAYRLVRHPIYGGIVLAAAGYALAVQVPLALLGAPVLLAFFRLKSGREEAWLRDRYPDYAAYARRTRRMLPWVY